MEKIAIKTWLANSSFGSSNHPSRSGSRRIKIKAGSPSSQKKLPKSQPYGFPIHGCIDGFRKIMWLSIVPSSNDPHVVGRLFYDCVAIVCNFAQHF